MLSFIEEEIRRTGADPARLVFEITETALMTDLRAGAEFARSLAGLGCGLAIDDFGTGFGSLVYLKKLPITQLKIDIEFVRDLATNQANRDVVEAIVRLAGRSTFAPWPRESKMTPRSSACGPPVSTLVRAFTSAVPPRSDHCLTLHEMVLPATSDQTSRDPQGPRDQIESEKGVMFGPRNHGVRPVHTNHRPMARSVGPGAVPTRVPH